MEIVYFHPDIKTFIESFDVETSADIFGALDLLKSRGYKLGMPFCKKIAKDLYELRIQSLHNIRVFYTFYERRIVLLYAIEKKTQKLKLKDLGTAYKRLKYLHS